MAFLGGMGGDHEAGVGVHCAQHPAEALEDSGQALPAAQECHSGLVVPLGGGLGYPAVQL